MLNLLSHDPDNQDAQSWYLLGRCYMAQSKFPKAYEAYQQAVYRDGRNPTFWCSIGVLYYQINQYRDALDAYSRAIRLNPYISEVWYDLGTLYESCNNQTADALDAYQRAAELDPNNTHIKARLQLLRSGGGAAGNQHNAPAPQDVHPQAYQNGVGVPPGPQWGVQPAQNQPQQPPHQPPIDAARVSEWQRGIPEINPPNPPRGLQLNGFESRDGMRAPPPRAPTPRQDGPHGYGDASRHTPVRKQSPSPKIQSAYPGAPQTLPQINSMQERPMNFGSGGVRPSPTMPGSAGPPPNGAPPPHLPPYGRPFSPPNELRPLRDERPRSPPSGFSRPDYQSGPPFPSMATSGAGAAQPLPVAEPPRDERPASAMKRGREWEPEQSGPSKKVANEENRAKLDEPSRHPSPPQKAGPPTPRDHYRRSSSEIRRENAERQSQNYHPSEAAHHPYSLPPQNIPSMQTILDGPKDDRNENTEPAARKMDVDEDYDNNSEDDKRAGSATASGTASKNSPAQALPKQEIAA